VFRNGIHGTRDKGRSQLDVARELTADIDIVETESNVSRHHNEIIVRIGDATRVPDKDLRGCETARKREYIDSQQDV
jgi:hypothetical protein